MIAAAGLGALLLAAQIPAGPPPVSPPARVAASQFAPPLGQPMAYRVTTRRLGRDGSLISFSLVYALQWQRVGRGYQLVATLQRIDSDARPEVTRALTAVLQPLVGEPMTYLVAPDGSRIDLVDAEALWDRAMARTEALGAAAGQAEAKQMAALIAALPVGQRSEMATADIRALVAPANAAIPASGGASVSIRQDGAMQSVALVEHVQLAAGQGGNPLEIDNLWTIDTATGLVVREQRQSWIIEPGSDARTLVEERVRALEPAAKD
ncbi:hypothetical protein FHR22_004006 [Sphingopyxis panaciterrae]|uniref:hypothetical protein n=1 Tax=Sphingopyxis panaciterrae TaxID=363841 RepID=UPI00141DCB0D|nr:hypothetical protein [Sphingopyxis panaciterrae]NIJ39259.1 hypothetical protein [Sphingopyxis panaciterrae]